MATPRTLESDRAEMSDDSFSWSAHLDTIIGVVAGAAGALGWRVLSLAWTAGGAQTASQTNATAIAVLQSDHAALVKDLSALRVDIAANYVTTAALDRVESRILAAVAENSALLREALRMAGEIVRCGSDLPSRLREPGRALGGE